MYVPVFWEERYTYAIQKIWNRERLGATWVEGMQLGGGGGGR